MPHDETDDGKKGGEGVEGEGEKVEKRTKRLQRIDTFHTYIKPTWQPVLSEFCTTLTGITQVSFPFQLSCR